MHASIRERRSEGGFTLIELLVVMIIIAILMAVAVPTFLAQKNSAQKTKSIANIKQIVNAIESCTANRTDGSHGGTAAGGCLQWAGAKNQLGAGLKTFEKGLVPLGASGTANPTLVGGEYTYQINAVGTQGYLVQTAIQDGNVTVYFAEIHYQDGGLKKVCNRTPMTAAAATVTPGGVLPGAVVAGSRTCTTGTWG